MVNVKHKMTLFGQAKNVDVSYEIRSKIQTGTIVNCKSVVDFRWAIINELANYE